MRPVYLIAAEGGGIRAAYWTASALATFEGCAARSGFVSSGISGGSVGFAVASTVDDEPAGAAAAPEGLDPAQEQAAKIVDRAKRVAGPDVVSTVVLGLAVGDMFAAGTGVHVPSYLSAERRRRRRGWRWRDRAALVEALWEGDGAGPVDRVLRRDRSADRDAHAQLDRRRLEVPPARRPGADRRPSRGSDRRHTAIASRASGVQRGRGPCDTVGGLPSMLGFRELAATGGSDATTKCLASLDWSTAAMLSARFAIVTPTGGLPAEPPCDELRTEPSSSTAGTSSPPPSRPGRHRAAADGEDRRRRTRSASTRRTVAACRCCVYLRNTQGYDLADDVARAESEPLVPITGGAAKGHLTAEDAWIQRITLAMPGACPDGEAADGLPGPRSSNSSGAVGSCRGAQS